MFVEHLRGSKMCYVKFSAIKARNDNNLQNRIQINSNKNEEGQFFRIFLIEFC